MIKYKKSLNMPRGKIIAQASHALGSFVLGCFDFKEEKFRTKDLNKLKEFIKNIKLKEVDDDEFNNSKFLLTIEDHGRTVFKGVPTVTCGIEIDSNYIDIFKYKPNEYEESSENEIQTRLVQVVDKQFARNDFELAMQKCVIMQSLHLVHFMQQPSFIKNEDFIKWAKGSFAKIVLVSKDNFLKELKEKNLNLDITWDDLNSCVIGPIQKDKVHSHTSTLKMM